MNGVRRGSSTFSNYYLNKQAKDLASLVTIEDRNEQDFRDDFILEQDNYNNENGDVVVSLPDKATKAGKGDNRTTATRAMFSFKSELNSLIGNL